MKKISIGKHTVGAGNPVYIVAEIGINHNGDLQIARQLIDLAAAVGCNAVKFQKRTPELCVPEQQRNVLRETPWGVIPYMEYRKKVEFGLEEYQTIDRYCRDKNIQWFVSCWDEISVEFINGFDVPCFKIPSAHLTNDTLLKKIRSTKKPVILSTGMSTPEQVDHAIGILGKGDLVLLHCNSASPAQNEELNLRVIPAVRERYDVPVGYSGPERGLASTIAAVALGAC